MYCFINSLITSKAERLWLVSLIDQELNSLNKKAHKEDQLLMNYRLMSEDIRIKGNSLYVNNARHGKEDDGAFVVTNHDLTSAPYFIPHSNPP